MCEMLHVENVAQQLEAHAPSMACKVAVRWLTRETMPTRAVTLASPKVTLSPTLKVLVVERDELAVPDLPVRWLAYPVVSHFFGVSGARHRPPTTV